MFILFYAFFSHSPIVDKIGKKLELLSRERDDRASLVVALVNGTTIASEPRLDQRQA
jgi:hypothetical protein